MKTLTTLFTALLLLILATAATAQTYVNQAATGNNDGTSWTDAYTELATALDNYSEGDEIWVAEGTYLPQPPSAWTDGPKNTFYLYQDVRLYGGFDGTETMLSERDPAAKVTILSGDLNGDDVDDDFEANRADNVINVLFLTADISPATIIDGFTIANGHADGDDSDLYNQEGGGVWSLGSPQIKQCRFEQNYVIGFGGGLFFRGASSDESVVESCVFTRNRSVVSGGGMLIATFGGPGIISVTDCQFIENISEASGGGLFIQSSSIEMSNCQFTQNSALGAGGGMWCLNNSGSDHQTSVTACTFEENTASNGGAINFIGVEGEDGDYQITDCDFNGNASIQAPTDTVSLGGAILVQFTGDDFQNNHFLIEDCSLDNNSAEFGGGGLLYYGPAGSDNHFEMNDCEVNGNRAPTAGGVALIEGGTNNTALVINTAFNQNEADGAMAAAVGLDIINPDIPAAVNPYTAFINCLFTNHVDDSGTAMVLEVFGYGVEATLTNCTFARNDSPTLGTDFSDPGGQINLLNSILSDAGFPAYHSGSMVNGGKVNSLGGNLIANTSLHAFLDSTDQSGIDPLFEFGTFRLSQNSPAVDAGVLLDEPTDTDFSGNARIQGSCIDIGAVESPYDAGVAECLVFTNTREVLDDPSTINIFPNPTSGLANIGIENQWTGELELRIVNALGQVVHTVTFEKYAEEAVVPFDAGHLPKGLYRVLVSDGQFMAVGSFIRL